MSCRSRCARRRRRPRRPAAATGPPREGCDCLTAPVDAPSRRAANLPRRAHGAAAAAPQPLPRLPAGAHARQGAPGKPRRRDGGGRASQRRRHGESAPQPAAAMAGPCLCRARARRWAAPAGLRARQRGGGRQAGRQAGRGPRRAKPARQQLEVPTEQRHKAGLKGGGGRGGLLAKSATLALPWTSSR